MNYKLKKLPLKGMNFASVEQLQRRVEDLEAIINLFDIQITEEDVIFKTHSHLFKEENS